MFESRYAMLTVDVEALPKRAIDSHVDKLIWGRHSKGTAGIEQLHSIGLEYNAPHIYFVDLCGAYDSLSELKNVVAWLHAAGGDVQLHSHPEVLPEVFWNHHGFLKPTVCMNACADLRLIQFVINFFSDIICDITGRRINAFRSGSFRWNSNVLSALGRVNIPLSFNNSMRAYSSRHCTFSVPTNNPFLWSNGVIEVPLTERQILAQPGGNDRWVSLTYPESSYFRYADHRGKLMDRLLGRLPDFTVFLLHSWSMLYWDENGHAVYKDDQRLEGYRKLLARISKDYDVITTSEFLDLHARGKIKTSQTVDIAQAEWPA